MKKTKQTRLLNLLVMVSSFRILITKLYTKIRSRMKYTGTALVNTVTKRMKAGTPSAKIDLLNYHSKMGRFIKPRGVFPQTKAYCMSNLQAVSYTHLTLPTIYSV